MSEHGSFVTNFILCGDCLAVAKEILIVEPRQKHLCSALVPGWLDDKPLPIIAGKIGGMYAGEEIHVFEFEYVPQLEARICHEMRIAVIAEAGEQIFFINPVAKESP